MKIETVTGPKLDALTELIRSWLGPRTWDRCGKQVNDMQILLGKHFHRRPTDGDAGLLTAALVLWAFKYRPRVTRRRRK